MRWLFQGGTGNGDGFLIYIGVPTISGGTGYVIAEKMPADPTTLKVTAVEPNLGDVR